MTVGQASGQPNGSMASSSGISGRAVERLLIYFVCTTAAILIILKLGKDLPWDTIHYHLYAGFSALHDRFSQDYFAAGPQSYDTPYAYVPFYLLVASGLTSLQIGLILAVVQSAILWLTYELALYVCPNESRHTRVAVGLLATALALANPILIQQFGTSFSDVTTSELVLLSWLTLAAAIQSPSLTKVFWGGAIAGIATALKATNAVEAMAAVGLIAMLPVRPLGLLKSAAIYGVACLLGFVVVSSPWSYHLQREFGNPVFPLMNNLFRSPYFTAQPLLHYRFVPAGIVDAILRPFVIAKPIYMIQEELRAPDVRYAALVLLSLVALSLWLFEHFGRSRSTGIRRGPMPSSSRVLLGLGLGLTTAWAAWLIASGNGRYFISMACVTAILVVGLLFHVLARWPKVRNYALLAIFLAQGTQLWIDAAYRWNPMRWTPGPWLSVQIPKKLVAEPNLYLTIGFQANAFLAAYLNPHSGLVNFTGSYPMAAQDANGRRVLALIKRFGPHVRMLMRGQFLSNDPESHEPQLTRIDTQLQPFGLRIDTSDCANIAVKGLPPDFRFTFVSGPSGHSPSDHGPPDVTYLLSCHLVPGAAGDSQLLASRGAVDRILDRLEDECPQLFQPSRAVSEPLGQGWSRSYINTDLIAWVSRGWLKFDDPIYSTGLTFIGQESDWLKGPVPIMCGRKDGHFFVKQLVVAPKHLARHDIAP